MAEASIPVDLFNPGQVFACLGFVEAADVLLGDAEGGFDWSNEADVRFWLRAAGNENPFGVVLGFLADSQVRCYASLDWSVPAKPKKGKGKNSVSASDDDIPAEIPAECLDIFPSPKADKMALPIYLVGTFGGKQHRINIDHWADASSRNDFKLYAGNRSAASIAQAMLAGTRDKPKKNQAVGVVKTRGLRALWQESRADLITRPFDVLTSVSGSFNFDPRGAWTGIDAGYSPDAQSHGVEASPIIEILVAIALEHARPDKNETRHVRYGVWGSMLPAMLARPAFGGANVGVPLRMFRFDLGGTKHNKVVTFAQEEMNP